MHEIVEKWCKIAENSTTYLSDSVKELVLGKGIAADVDPKLTATASDLLDITNLSSILLNDGGYLLPPTERNGDWYSQHIQDVAPFFFHAQMVMKATSEKELQNLIKLCDWMHQPQVVSLCFSLLTRKEEKELHLNSHECLLLITAALERALGNLFLHGDQKRKVPSLLRDLLASQELVLLLGAPQVVLLQLLLGNPLSLNLRNLIWHGFVSFQEMDTHRYASVLLLVCAAIGRHLDLRRSITVNEITPRRWATLKPLPKWSEFLNEELLAEAVSTTRGLPSSRKAIWHRAIIHHQRGRYGRCCALIMPEIEHTLRLIYCATNDCPSRALTAESVVHYTTLDVILECNESKSMVDFLGVGLYSALLDMFVHLEGPRVRDRFSHGECRLLEIDASVSRHLLALSTALLGLADTQSGQICPHYSPQYSPAAIFQQEVMETMEVVGDWLQLVSAVVVDQPVDPIITGWPVDCLPLLTDWLQNWSLAVHRLLKDHLRENYRPRGNPLAATWRRMMSQFVLGCQRMTVYRTTSSTLSSLRSRQRSSHARLDSYMCLFVRAVQVSLLFPVAVCLGGEVVNDPNTVRRVKRSVTRWADNFAIASANKCWIELAKCARDVLQSMESLPVVFHQ